MQSEPDRHAAQQQRVQPQVQIRIAIHNHNVTTAAGSVKWFLIGSVLVAWFVVVSALRADLIEPQAQRYTFPSGR